MKRLGVVVVAVALLGACGDDGGGASTTAATEATTTVTAGADNGIVIEAFDPCDVGDAIDLELLAGFAVGDGSASSGSLNDVEFDVCQYLEADAEPDNDGTIRPRAVAIQVASGDAAAAVEVVSTSPIDEEADLGSLPVGSFVTDQFGSKTVWVPVGVLFGVSVTKSLGGGDYESDVDAAAAIAATVLEELA